MIWKTFKNILTSRKTCLEKKRWITQMWHGIDHKWKMWDKWTLAGVGAVHWKVQEWRRSAKHPTCSPFAPALPHPPSPVGSMKGKDCKKMPHGAENHCKFWFVSQSKISHLRSLVHPPCMQRHKKSKLSGWQNFMRKNFPDGVRKSFSRHMCAKSA